MEIGKTYRVTLPFNSKPNVFKVVGELDNDCVRVEIISGPRPYKGATHSNIFNYADAEEV